MATFTAMDKHLPDSSQPLISTEALILETLRSGENCCAGIVDKIREGTHLAIRQSTVYVNLTRLTDEGLVRATRLGHGAYWRSRQAEYYELTVAGKFRAETNRRIVAALFDLDFKR